MEVVLADSDVEAWVMRFAVATGRKILVRIAARHEESVDERGVEAIAGPLEAAHAPGSIGRKTMKDGGDVSFERTTGTEEGKGVSRIFDVPYNNVKDITGK